jgi:TnpA family transposase
MRISGISGSVIAHNRFGFALQLCVLRYPGRVLAPGELIPAGLGFYRGPARPDQRRSIPMPREETRHEHLADLRQIYGYRSFSGRGARDLRDWIAREAEAATSNEDLARRFVAECRRTRTILPGSSTIERLCADALVEAERRMRIVSPIASRRP